MMRKALAVCALALSVTGCAHKLSPEMVQIVSCEAYSSTLIALAGYRAQHLLSPAQIATVEQWRPTLNAACTAPATGVGVLDQIEQGVIALNGLSRGVVQ